MPGRGVVASGRCMQRPSGAARWSSAGAFLPVGVQRGGRGAHGNTPLTPGWFDVRIDGRPPLSRRVIVTPAVARRSALRFLLPATCVPLPPWVPRGLRGIMITGGRRFNDAMATEKRAHGVHRSWPSGQWSRTRDHALLVRLRRPKACSSSVETARSHVVRYLMDPAGRYSLPPTGVGACRSGGDRCGSVARSSGPSGPPGRRSFAQVRVKCADGARFVSGARKERCVHP